MSNETKAAARVYAEPIADQLLADLNGGVIDKIGLDDIEQYVAGRYLSMRSPRPGLRELVDWTVRLVVQKAARLTPRNAIYGTNEQAE